MVALIDKCHTTLLLYILYIVSNPNISFNDCICLLNLIDTPGIRTIES